jgi:hypothetical protein
LSNSNNGLEINFQQELGKKDVATKQNLTLENSKRKMIEIESVSINIMENLNRNNENLLNVNNKVSNLNKEIDFGAIIIRRIFRKENKNKLLIIGFSMALIIIFVLFISNHFKLLSL